MTEIVFHKVDILPEKNLSNYIGHIFFTSNGGIYMCRRTEDDRFEWKPFGAVVDPGIIPTYEEILAIAQGKADDVATEFNGKFGEITKFEDEISLTVGDLKKGLQGLDEKYNGFVSEFAVESENIRGRLTGVENGQVAVQTLLNLGLDKSVLNMQERVNNVVEKSTQMEMTVNGIKTQVEDITGMKSQFEQLDNKIETSVTNATSGIEARLTVAEGKIESTVSSEEFNSKMTQLPGQINQAIEDKTADMRSAINQLPDQISTTVANATTSAEILAKINGDESEVKIKADKINIEGTLTVGEGVGENIEGHNFFRVNNGGNIEARNAIIYGAINADEGHIGSLNIDSDGSLYVKEGSRDIYRLGADGKLTANNAVLTGRISADEGYIGNVEIRDGGLRSVDGENFRLDGSGHLAVRNASVEGEIEANSGHIGGIIIEGGGLRNGENFSLSSEGILTVKNANISGTVTADMGNFGILSVGENELRRSVIEGNLNENGDEVKHAELNPGNVYCHHSIQISPEIIDMSGTWYRKVAGTTSVYDDEALGDESVRISCLPNTDAGYDLNGAIEVYAENKEKRALWTDGVVEAGSLRRSWKSYGDPYQEAVASPFKNLEVALVFNSKSHFRITYEDIKGDGNKEWCVYVDGMRVLTHSYINPHGYDTLTVDNNIIQSSDGIWQLKWGTNEYNVYNLGCYTKSYDKSLRPNTIFITFND